MHYEKSFLKYEPAAGNVSRIIFVGCAKSSGTRKELFTTFGSCSWRSVHIIQTLRSRFNSRPATINRQIIEIAEILKDTRQNILGPPKYLSNSFHFDFELNQEDSFFGGKQLILKRTRGQLFGTQYIYSWRDKVTGNSRSNGPTDPLLCFPLAPLAVATSVFFQSPVKATC